MMQTAFLGRLVDSQIDLFVFLVNGIKLRGKLVAFDRFSLALQAAASIQTIFKSAVSTIYDASAAPTRTGQTSEGSSQQAQCYSPMLETTVKYRRRVRLQ
ncbi:RNA chaperone Hfq [Caballeronia grimmiae]|uniref:RNA chaperone Hfq n=1 Tax=Caballeronia grimmiae TaxID=1071679 RepID=UPI0038B7A223